MTEPTTIAILGLGAMGLPMATRLAEKWGVKGFDPTPERAALAEGGEWRPARRPVRRQPGLMSSCSPSATAPSSIRPSTEMTVSRRCCGQVRW
ncbi:NAD(P)-binding domain-containing protein [Tessaracoccus coleopterorum]|uniref:NAD(P)-binding domain-containing protein n=1 Tax=Tessaracoccus coleopterorum TaxID=2714950 RepID=UPI0022B22A10|nr:NAD(P)-binding domain-containing protein [Tessaracoccus coleopterorum]